MIPLRDNQPTSTFPIITILLIAANVIVFIAQQTVPGLESALELVPYRVTHPFDPSNFLLHVTNAGEAVQRVPAGYSPTALGPNDVFIGPSIHPAWATIFTSMFMHANLLHIGGNMLFLWIFGNNIEDALGKVRFLVFYLVCGLAASLLQIAMGPDSLIPNVGASGAIAGVLGAYLLLYPNALVLSIVPIFGLGFITQVRARWVLLVWVVYDILPAFFSGGAMSNGGGVAYFAHLGGFGAGVLIILALGGSRLADRQQQRAYDPPPPGGGYR